MMQEVGENWQDPPPPKQLVGPASRKITGNEANMDLISRTCGGIKDKEKADKLAGKASIQGNLGMGWEETARQAAHEGWHRAVGQHASWERKGEENCVV